MITISLIRFYIITAFTAIVEIKVNEIARTFTNCYLKQFTIIINLTFAAASSFAL